MLNIIQLRGKKMFSQTILTPKQEYEKKTQELINLNKELINLNKNDFNRANLIAEIRAALIDEITTLEEKIFGNETTPSIRNNSGSNI